MKKMISLQKMVLLLFSMIPMLFTSCKPEAPGIYIIPKPVKCEKLKGDFMISTSTKIYYSPDDQAIKSIADQFVSILGPSMGKNLDVEAYAESKPQAGNILFKLSAIPTDLGEEGYQLDVEPKGVLVQSNSLAGLFYGMQTLRQLLPPAAEQRESNTTSSSWVIPCVSITDRPRFSWRGMHLDVSRHFFPVDFIKKYIDYLAMYKINRFHWHLTDDQGWRIEIKQYPKLTEVGAWRVDREDKPWNEREKQKPGETATYGGYYTQDQIREIVKYAADRFITIVPEIEMPAHSGAALASYPEFSCTGKPQPVPTGGVWPITNLYCAGNEQTFSFLENVLTEVMVLFPSEYIHIGGDEATKTEWEHCPKCQKRIKVEGLKNVDELQSYFVKRIEKSLNSKGRKLIGWDEILEGGLAPEATVMSWRGVQGGIDAAKQGHDVVMTPTLHCYFDYYQGPRNLEPWATGEWLPLSKVYSYEPVPEELTPEEAVHILGTQANVWTEFIPSPSHAEYMIFPRMTALAEVAWTPAEMKDWNDYSTRVLQHMKRWDCMNINYAKSSMNVLFHTGYDSLSGHITAVLGTELTGLDIHYTSDGTDPVNSSTQYSKPLPITESVLIKAAAFINGNLAAQVNEQSFSMHLAVGRKVTVTNPYATQYSGGGDYALTNAIRGSLEHTDGNWQGYEGVDLDASLVLDSLTAISKITIGFLNKIEAWIFLPVSVVFEISKDGKNFLETRIARNEADLNNPKVYVRDFQVLFEPKKVRYIRIKAQNIGIVPAWHEGAGGKAWIFADEIIVE